MPGLAVHAGLNTFTGMLLRARRYLWLFILGGMLPDILTRIPSILVPATYWYVVPFHAPLVLVVVCYVLCFTVPQPYRITAFFWLCGGVALHCIPDAFQKHLGMGYPWLFPFSWRSYQWGLFWPEQSLWALPVLAVTALIVLYARYRRKHGYVKTG
jgi:hypothetical protein